VAVPAPLGHPAAVRDAGVGEALVAIVGERGQRDGRVREERDHRTRRLRRVPRAAEQPVHAHRGVRAGRAQLGAAVGAGRHDGRAGARHRLVGQEPVAAVRIVAADAGELVGRVGAAGRGGPLRVGEEVQVRRDHAVPVPLPGAGLHARGAEPAVRLREPREVAARRVVHRREAGGRVGGEHLVAVGRVAAVAGEARGAGIRSEQERRPAPASALLHVHGVAALARADAARVERERATGCEADRQDRGEAKPAHLRAEPSTPVPARAGGRCATSKGYGVERVGEASRSRARARDGARRVLRSGPSHGAVRHRAR
jgi:hypothetical protein